jgi:hypothetical protein
MAKLIPPGFVSTMNPMKAPKRSTSIAERKAVCRFILFSIGTLRRRHVPTGQELRHGGASSGPLRHAKLRSCELRPSILRLASRPAMCTLYSVIKRPRAIKPPGGRAQCRVRNIAHLREAMRLPRRVYLEPCELDPCFAPAPVDEGFAAAQRPDHALVVDHTLALPDWREPLRRHPAAVGWAGRALAGRGVGLRCLTIAKLMLSTIRSGSGALARRLRPASHSSTFHPL